ncbi:helix-turn-helix transcriptional regulator [Enterococcus hirae]
MKKVSNLSRYRKEKGFSQIELAKKMNVTQQCVSSWQTGRTIPKPYQMKTLSEILSVPMNELFSDVFNKVNS